MALFHFPSRFGPRQETENKPNKQKHFPRESERKAKTQLKAHAMMLNDSILRLMPHSGTQNTVPTFHSPLDIES